jgi:pilus assembly protein CpaE
LPILPRIEIIDSDIDASEQLQRALESEGYDVVTTVTGQAGIAMAERSRPSLVVLDVDLPDIDGYEVLRTLRGTPGTARTPIFIYSARAEVDAKVAGFKAGADDYIVKPAATGVGGARPRAALRSDVQRLAHIVALWGAKGGVGTTTLASNLAVALRSKTNGRVTLMDASVLGGSMEVLLNLPPRHTIGDLLPRLDDLDAELLRSVLAQHSSGVRALLSAPWRTNGNVVQPTHYERLLAWLQPANDYVVVDTSPSLDESTLTVLQLVDQVVLVLTPEMTAMRNAKLFLDVARPLREESQQLTLALNRHQAKGGIALRDIEAALRTKVKVQIPADEALVTFSINRGIPVVVSHPRSAVARGMFQLADEVIAAAKEGKRVAIMSTLLGRGA